MEDILSSIKRIIAEENDQPTRGRRPARPAPRAEPDPFAHDEILELDVPAPDPVPSTTQPPPVEAAPAVATAPPRTDAILSPHAAEASRGPLDALSRLVVKPDVSGSDTLEGMVRELLRPMLRDWLDTHLPAMVEQMVAREIERITGK